MRKRAALPLAIYFHGLPSPVAEFRFHATRKWRFDLAWPDYRVAVEQDGGVWSGGRHTRGAGFVKDMEKLNHAALAGWCVFRFTPQQIRSGYAREFIQEIFK